MMIIIIGNESLIRIIIIIVRKGPLTVGVPSFQALDTTVKPDFQSYS